MIDLFLGVVLIAVIIGVLSGWIHYNSMKDTNPFDLNGW